LSRRLKEAGDKGTQRELGKAITTSLAPVKAALPDSARATLPKSGGLAEKNATSKFTLNRRTRAKTYGVRLTAKNTYSLQPIDQGVLRHPVYAKPTESRKQWTWVNQTVTAGWFSTVILKNAPQIRAEIQAAMDAIAKRIAA